MVLPYSAVTCVMPIPSPSALRRLFAAVPVPVPLRAQEVLEAQVLEVLGPQRHRPLDEVERDLPLGGAQAVPPGAVHPQQAGERAIAQPELALFEAQLDHEPDRSL